LSNLIKLLKRVRPAWNPAFDRFPSDRSEPGGPSCSNLLAFDVPGRIPEPGIRIGVGNEFPLWPKMMRMKRMMLMVLMVPIVPLLFGVVRQQ
jgi:hypothetical protein